MVNHACPCLDSTLLRAALAGTILSQIIFHCVWMPLALDQNNCFVLTFKMCFLKLLLVFRRVLQKLRTMFKNILFQNLTVK